MCNIQSVTLQTAVLMQVKEFANSNQTFSIHDITREVRQKVNNGALEIPEVEVAGTSFRFDIPHTKVKAIFDELWRTGVFDPDFSLNRSFNGTYFEYAPSPIAAAILASSFSVAHPPATSSAPVPSVRLISGVHRSILSGKISHRIEQYLDNCETRQFQPTLKQVQSAIKRGNVSTGWSCEDIRKIIIEDLGFSVIQDPDYVSASKVVV